MIANQQRLLVTTPLEESWGTDEEIVFLGEWCRLNKRRASYERRRHTTLAYHWDDRAKLGRDADALMKLTERLLKEVGGALNERNNTKYGERYWRMTLGYWLYLFVAIVFDRWEMVRRAATTPGITGSIVFDLPREALVANDSSAFVSFIDHDLWNHALFARLLAEATNIPLTRMHFPGAIEFADPRRQPLRRRSWLKRAVVETWSKATAWTARPDASFFIATYLSVRDDWRLQWRLGQLPKYWPTADVPIAPCDFSLRAWQLPAAARRDAFGGIIRKLIPEFLPRIFLEGRKSLDAAVTQLPWPQRPRVIFTSNAHIYDDIFKTWAGRKVEAGSRLVIGRHGGGALYPFSGFTAFEQPLGDAYLVSGPGNEVYENARGVGVYYSRWRTGQWNPAGKALVVCVAMPRYSFDLRPMPIGGQMLDYFEGLFRLVEALPSRLHPDVCVRAYAADHGWAQRQRWFERLPAIEVTGAGEPLRDAVTRSRLCISTYNATTYNESLVANVPTLIFWNSAHWELTAKSQPYFDELRAAGIFHEDAVAAARHIAVIWEDVGAWWHSAHVQEARARFCAHYAAQPADLIDRIGDALEGKPARPAAAGRDRLDDSRVVAPYALHD